MGDSCIEKLILSQSKRRRLRPGQKSVVYMCLFLNILVAVHFQFYIPQPPSWMLSGPWSRQHMLLSTNLYTHKYNNDSSHFKYIFFFWLKLVRSDGFKPNMPNSISPARLSHPSPNSSALYFVAGKNLKIRPYPA